MSQAPTITLPHGKIRCHGDFHLNQVLWTDNDFVILDFEGEPARALSERRSKQSPLRDVAGMLRSFHYAAYTGLMAYAEDRPKDFESLAPWARFWTVWACTAFLESYQKTVKGIGFYPTMASDVEKLIDLFLWEKVLYELNYELNSRPDWVRIPLEGILSLLPASSPATPEGSPVVTAKS